MFGIDILGFARDLYESFMSMLVSFISVTIDFSGVKIVQDMLGNAEGVGLMLSGYVAITMALAAIVTQRYRYNALVSIVVIVMAPVLFGIWLAFLDGLRSIGAGLNSIIVGIDTAAIKSNIVLPMPGLDITAAMWNVPIFLLSGASGFWFMSMFAIMAIINVVIAIIGLWLLAMYGFGPRTRRNFSIVVSLAIVTFCIGQPIVLAIIKLSMFIGGMMPVIPGSVGLAGLFGLAGQWLAGLVLISLPFLLYHPVHSVMGRMNAAVSNRVRTQVDNKPKVDAKVNGQVNTNNRLVSAQKGGQFTAKTQEARRLAGATGSVALLAMLKKTTVAAAAAGSNVHPVVKGAYIGGAALSRSLGNPKPPREKDHLVYK